MFLYSPDWCLCCCIHVCVSICSQACVSIHAHVSVCVRVRVPVGICALRHVCPQHGAMAAPCRPAGGSICWGGALLSGGRSAGPTTTPRPFAPASPSDRDVQLGRPSQGLTAPHNPIHKSPGGGGGRRRVGMWIWTWWQLWGGREEGRGRLLTARQRRQQRSKVQAHCQLQTKQWSGPTKEGGEEQKGREGDSKRKGLHLERDTGKKRLRKDVGLDMN